MVTRNTDVIYRIQCHPTLHLDRFGPYLQATWDEQPLRRQIGMSKGKWEQIMCSYLSKTMVSPFYMVQEVKVG